MFTRKLLDFTVCCCLAVAGAAWGAPQTSQTAGTEAPPTISARIAWQDGYFIDDIQDLDGAEPVELGGDFVIGEPVTSIKPDVESLARERPDLLGRLEEIRYVAVRAIVDREGRVTNLRFEEDIEPDVRDLFVETLREARFAPTVHFERGPVFVQVALDYSIERPETASSNNKAHRELVGEEVGELVRLMPDSDADAHRTQVSQARYARILGKAEAPVLHEADADFVLSFLVTVDSSGNVTEARPVKDSRDPRPLEEFSQRLRPLIAFVESFRFEPQYLRDGAPARFVAMVDLRFSDHGVEVASRATVNESDLETRLAEAYRLDEGRVLDLLPPPHPPERMVLYRMGHPVEARETPEGPDWMVIDSGYDGQPTYAGGSFGCDRLECLLGILDIPAHKMRLDDALQEVRIEADVLMRFGAPTDELLADLEDALRERLGLDLAFHLRTGMIPTLIMRGSIGNIPEDPKFDRRRVVHVFTDSKNDDPRFDRGAGPPLTDSEALARRLSVHLDMPVVDETEGPPEEPFHVRLYRSSFRTERLDMLIHNLEAQTDLDIRIEDRPTEVLYVTQRSGT